MNVSESFEIVPFLRPFGPTRRPDLPSLSLSTRPVSLDLPPLWGHWIVDTGAKVFEIAETPSRTFLVAIRIFFELFVCFPSPFIIKVLFMSTHSSYLLELDKTSVDFWCEVNMIITFGTLEVVILDWEFPPLSLHDIGEVILQLSLISTSKFLIIICV